MFFSSINYSIFQSLCGFPYPEAKIRTHWFNPYLIHSLSDPFVIRSIGYPIHLLSDPFVIWSIRYPIHSLSDPFVIQSIRYLIHTVVIRLRDSSLVQNVSCLTKRFLSDKTHAYLFQRVSVVNYIYGSSMVRWERNIPTNTMLST